ncbi:MarR family transcriptional regulator, partial [Halobacteriales archaeon QH_3_68_24]
LPEDGVVGPVDPGDEESVVDWVRDRLPF